MTIAYIRVSTEEQILDRQYAAMEKYCKNSGINDFKIVAEKITGTKAAKERKFNDIIENQELTHLLVNSVTRLGRSFADIVNTIDAFKKRGVKITIVRLGVSSLLESGKKNPAFGIIVALMAQLSEDELELMKERQKQGIAIAKAKGKYTGRKVGTVDSKEKLLSKYPLVVKTIKNKGGSVRDISKICDVSINTVRKVQKALGE